MISFVQIPNLLGVWEQAAEVLAPAIALRPTHTANDVQRMLLAGTAQLWIQHEDDRIDAACITEFAVYPQGVWIRVWLDAARPDAKQDTPSFLQAIDGWRKAHKARGFECAGRLGWARVFPQARPEGILLRWTEE